MRRRRAMIVRIAAGVGVALALMALPIPRASLRAQVPDSPPDRKSDPGPPSVPGPDSTPSPIKTEPVAPPSDPRPGPVVSETERLANEALRGAKEPNPLPPAVENPPPPSRVLPSSSGAAYQTERLMADPEAAAKGFIEKSTKEADEAIKALSREAEILRARLQKVEAGLVRWQGVKAALESNNGRAGWRPKNEPGIDSSPRVSVPGGSSLPSVPSPAGSTFDPEPPRPAIPDNPQILDPIPSVPNPAPTPPPASPSPGRRSPSPRAGPRQRPRGRSARDIAR